LELITYQAYLLTAEFFFKYDPISVYPLFAGIF